MTSEQDYVIIAEYPEDPYFRIGTLHFVKPQERADGSLVEHALEIGEVICHGRDPAVHRKFAELVMLAETTEIPLSESDYEILSEAEGPVLRFPDGSEEWYPGKSISLLSAVTGYDPVSHWRERYGINDSER